MPPRSTVPSPRSFCVRAAGTNSARFGRARLQRAPLRGTASSLSLIHICYRGLTLDPDMMEARLEGRPLELTAREFELLRAFISSPGRVFTREVLLAKIWGYDFFGDERVVDSHIKNLRRKLGVDYIETVRGVGYRAAKENQMCIRDRYCNEHGIMEGDADGKFRPQDFVTREELACTQARLHKSILNIIREMIK